MAQVPGTMPELLVFTRAIESSGPVCFISLYLDPDFLCEYIALVGFFSVLILKSLRAHVSINICIFYLKSWNVEVGTAVKCN